MLMACESHYAKINFETIHLMKKFICLSGMLLLAMLGCAQDNNPSKAWNAEVGPMVTVPIRYMHYYTVLGLGADAAVNRNIIDNLYVGGRINFAYFFGKGSVTGEDINIGLLNTMADAYYLFDFHLLLGFSGGLGLAFGGTNVDANFSRVFYAGYLLNTNQHDYVITGFFDQTNYQKNIGVRFAWRLPVSNIVAGKKQE